MPIPILFAWSWLFPLLIGPVAADSPDRIIEQRSAELHWIEPEAGIRFAEYRFGDTSKSDSLLAVLTIDPSRWSFELLMAQEHQDSSGRSARAWSELSGAPIVFNAGMYLPDRRRHVGYARKGAMINQPRIAGDYLSAVIFDPHFDSLPLFRIADLDVDSLADLNWRYGTVIQNLRLLKAPGENRWPESSKRWSELALAEDSLGRAVVIFCSFPITMHRFNKLLLELPLGLRAAQHLEGGIEAQLVINLPGLRREFIGLSKAGGVWQERSLAGELPNVLAVRQRRKGQ